MTTADRIADDEENPSLTPRAIHRAAVATGAFWPTATGLVFLLFMILPAWRDLDPWRAGAVTGLGVVFGMQYLYSVGIRAYPMRVRWAWLAGVWCVLLLLGLLLGADVVFMVMYVVVIHAVLMPWRSGRIAVVVLGLAGLAWGLAVGEVFAVFLAVGGTLFALGLGFTIQKSILEERLERAEERSALLAVAAERERIGRDLHDILGHSLTTITVSAQLARRLLETDPAAAGAQLEEIERISRQSLADVRATASGMQQVRVATEIASARSVLAAAGIEADVPAALPVLDDARAELFGYVVREGITNVVRHSRAHRCSIRVAPDEVVVQDDGTGIPDGRRRTGLAGLARRVEGAGGRLVVEPAPGGGTVLRARLDGAPPARRGGDHA